MCALSHHDRQGLGVARILIPILDCHLSNQNFQIAFVYENKLCDFSIKRFINNRIEYCVSLFKRQYKIQLMI